jgi:uncharacterized protein (TIGR02266 family)
MIKERRKHLRAKVNWPVDVKAGQTSINGETLNISPSGVFIRCENPLKLNQVLQLTIRVPEIDKTLTATAEVVWSNIYGPDDEVTPRGMGVQFIRLDSGSREFLQALITKLYKMKQKP